MQFSGEAFRGRTLWMDYKSQHAQRDTEERGGARGGEAQHCLSGRAREACGRSPEKRLPKRAAQRLQPWVLGLRGHREGSRVGRGRGKARQPGYAEWWWERDGLGVASEGRTSPPGELIGGCADRSGVHRPHPARLGEGGGGCHGGSAQASAHPWRSAGARRHLGRAPGASPDGRAGPSPAARAPQRLRSPGSPGGRRPRRPLHARRPDRSPPGRSGPPALVRAAPAAVLYVLRGPVLCQRADPLLRLPHGVHRPQRGPGLPARGPGPGARGPRRALRPRLRPLRRRLGTRRPGRVLGIRLLTVIPPVPSRTCYPQPGPAGHTVCHRSWLGHPLDSDGTPRGGPPRPAYPKASRQPGNSCPEPGGGWRGKSQTSGDLTLHPGSFWWPVWTVTSCWCDVYRNPATLPVLHFGTPYPRSLTRADSFSHGGPLAGNIVGVGELRGGCDAGAVDLASVLRVCSSLAW